MAESQILALIGNVASQIFHTTIMPEPQIEALIGIVVATQIFHTTLMAESQIEALIGTYSSITDISNHAQNVPPTTVFMIPEEFKMYKDFISQERLSRRFWLLKSSDFQ